MAGTEGGRWRTKSYITFFAEYYSNSIICMFSVLI